MSNHIRAGQRIRVFNEDRALARAAAVEDYGASAVNYDYGTIYGLHGPKVYKVIMDNGENRLFFVDDFEIVEDTGGDILWLAVAIGVFLVGFLVWNAVI